MASQKNKGILSYLKWGESYTSLILGIVIVVIIGILIISFTRNSRNGETSSTKDEATQTSEEETLSTYTVKAGDDLWSISNEIYKSGYNWVDIAKANNLTDPGVIHTGNKLKIPDVKPIVVMDETKESVANPIISDKYTVKEGDNLWDISERAYGDGFRYVDIVKANNIENPNVIFVSVVLKIPR